jgi:HTH-type transcriptional regulator/antitoxin HigA
MDMATKDARGFAPDYASPPGETILETIEHLGMSQSELARRMGRPLKTINEIIHGKTMITDETAIQLEYVLGVPSRFWLNRERRYREALARDVERHRLAQLSTWVSQFPLLDLRKRGYIKAERDKATIAAETLAFLGVTSPEAWQKNLPQVAYRRSKSFEAEPGAVAAWMRVGELKARQIECRPYDEAVFKASLYSIRKLVIEHPRVAFPQMVEIFANCGIALVIEQEFSKTHLCGLTRWLTPTKALIQLSLRHKTEDHFWFTLFHESCHVIKHSKKEIFIDEKDGLDDEKEHEADEFSRDLLIPSQDYRRFVRGGSFYAADIRRFAHEIEVSPGIVVGRLQHDKAIPFSAQNDLKMKVSFFDKPT